jgi:hypothetical protein
MKRLLTLAAVAAAAVAMSGCAVLSGVNTKASPEVQKTQAEADAALKTAFAARLDHCRISGQVSLGLGGIAGAGTGAATTGSFDCQPKPWEPIIPGSAPATPPPSFGAGVALAPPS